MDLTGLLIFGGFFAFMYMFLIRPQQQRQKQTRELLSSLAVGDEVITVGGMHGRIIALDETSVDLTVADGLTVVFERSAIGARREEADESVS